MSTSAQFTTMYLLVEYDDTIRREFIPINRTRSVHAEPLPGYRVPILEAGITNVAQRNTTVLCEALSNPVGIGSGLLDPQVVMFAVATEIDSAALKNNKVAGILSN